MRWRFSSSTRMGWFLVAGGVALLAALIAVPRLRDHEPPPSAPVKAGPETAGFLDKGQFKALLKPIVDQEEARARVSAFAARRRRCRPDGAVRVEGRMTRVLDTGEEFDSSLIFHLRPEGDEASLRLDVAPAHREPWTYLAHLSGGTQLRADLYSQGKVRRLRDGSGNAPDPSASATITVGDLAVADALAYLSVRDGDLVAAGWSESMGSERLLVIDWQPPADAVALGAAPSSRISALLYVQPDSAALRSARVFDEAGHLVRVVGDLLPSSDGDPCHIASFQGSTPARHSHTLYHIGGVSQRLTLPDALFSESSLVSPDGGVGAPDLR